MRKNRNCQVPRRWRAFGNCIGQTYVDDLLVSRRSHCPLNYTRTGDGVQSGGERALLTVCILLCLMPWQGKSSRVRVLTSKNVSPPLRTVTVLLPDGREEVFHRGAVIDPVVGLTADLSKVFS